VTSVAPCLWFDGKAEEAARFYVSLLPDSRIDRVNRTPADTPFAPAGSAVIIEFTLAGSPYLALNGGPQFTFTEAISLSVACDAQAEVDRLWDALTADGGAAGRCGWLKDRYGLSWQIVPSRLPELLCGTDRDRAARAMNAMMTMSKLDVAALEAA